MAKKIKNDVNYKEQCKFKSIGVKNSTYDIIDAVNIETGMPRYVIMHKAIKHAVEANIFDIKKKINTKDE